MHDTEVKWKYTFCFILKQKMFSYANYIEITRNLFLNHT